jgi:hypothetical protein
MYKNGEGQNIQIRVHKTPFTVFLFPITILLIKGRDMDLYLQAQQMSEWLLLNAKSSAICQLYHYNFQ